MKHEKIVSILVMVALLAIFALVMIFGVHSNAC